jgi:hypothetical protein
LANESTGGRDGASSAFVCRVVGQIMNQVHTPCARWCSQPARRARPTVCSWAGPFGLVAVHSQPSMGQFEHLKLFRRMGPVGLQRRLDFITMSALSTRVDCGCLTAKAQEEGAEHDPDRRRLLLRRSAHRVCKSRNWECPLTQEPRTRRQG